MNDAEQFDTISDAWRALNEKSDPECWWIITGCNDAGLRIRLQRKDNLSAPDNPDVSSETEGLNDELR